MTGRKVKKLKYLLMAALMIFTVLPFGAAFANGEQGVAGTQVMCPDDLHVACAVYTITADADTPEMGGVYIGGWCGSHTEFKGSDSESYGFIDFGDKVKVYAQAKAGYHFLEWHYQQETYCENKNVYGDPGEKDGVEYIPITLAGCEKIKHVTAVFAEDEVATPTPTSTPTEAPTPTPTPTPTEGPTPTPTPTEAPTEGPTPTPTPTPTEGPTPTPMPTEAPTETPTPTLTPTEAPTETPTPTPTSSPAEEPTAPPNTADPDETSTPVPASESTPVPTQEPTPVVTPSPEVRAIIIESPVPEIMAEESAPVAPASLPKTGGVPSAVFYGLGGLICTAGVLIRKKLK